MSWSHKVGKGKAFSDDAFVKWLGEVEDQRGSALYSSPSREALKIRCGNAKCRCTHDYPCEGGWIERHDGTMDACRTCKADVAKIQETARDRQELQRTVRDDEAREAARSATAWDN